MYKLFKENYLFLVLFLLAILKEPIYKIIKLEEVKCNLDCKYLEEDYNKLLEFSNIKMQYESDYLNAYIIYKDMYNFMNEIIIRGGDDLALSGNPVIYNNTLLGIITDVYENSSKVRLLTNKKSKVSVKINNEYGVLEYENNNLIVRDINNYSNINLGDEIYTSGLGNIRENIYIGKVSSIKIDNKNIEKIITVDYKLDIKNINFVTILKESKWYIYTYYLIL